MITLTKAKSKDIARRLDSLLSRNIRTTQVALRQWFDFTIKQVRSDISRKFKKDITTSLTNWDFVEEQGRKILKPATLEIMRTGGQEAYGLLATKGSFDILNTNSVRAAEKFAGELVTNVTKETKKAIRTHIAAGIKEGKSMPKIGKELRTVVGLNDKQAKAAINYRSALKEKYPKLSAAELDAKTSKYRGKVLRQRGVTIARTETARAQNLGYIQGLEDVGVVEVEFQVAGGACEICEALNGTKYSTEKAGDIIPVHPNCRCCMLPVVGDKTVSEQLTHAPPDLPGALASEEGAMPWKQYLDAHRGEKSNSAVLYDFYKVRYETTGKLAPSGMKHLRAHAAKFEATSVKISKPIPGLGDLIKPIKVPLGPKPPVIVPKPKPAVPKIYEAPNIGKAEGYARRILGIPITDPKARKMISYKGIDVKAADHVNEGLLRFKRKFPQLKIDAIEVGGKGKNIYAEIAMDYRTGKTTLILDGGTFKDYKSLARALKRNGKTNYLVGDSIEDLIAHEMGHVLNYHHLVAKHGSRARMEVDRLKTIRFNQKGLSKYAASDGAEGLAEIFSKYMKTDSLKGISSVGIKRPAAVELAGIKRILKTYAGVEL